MCLEGKKLLAELICVVVYKLLNLEQLTEVTKVTFNHLTKSSYNQNLMGRTALTSGETDLDYRSNSFSTLIKFVFVVHFKVIYPTISD